MTEIPRYLRARCCACGRNAGRGETETHSTPPSVARRKVTPPSSRGRILSGQAPGAIREAIVRGSDHGRAKNRDGAAELPHTDTVTSHRLRANNPASPEL